MEIFDIEFKKRLWAILIFTSFAGVISQVSSTQTDLCVGALFVSSIYSVLSYEKEKRLSKLYFGSLALSLAFGVKSTGVIGAVPIVIWFMIILRKDFIKFFLFLILNSFIFSSYNYILNFINYGSFLGARSAILGHGFWGGIKGGIANFIRYIFQFFDFSGFTIGFYLNKYLLVLQDKALALLSIPKGLGENVGLSFTNISMTEQVLGFGILGFLVFLPCSVLGFFKKNTRIFSVLFWAQIAVLSFSIAYMIYSVRFMTTFICTAIPVISLTYFRKMNIYKFFIMFFALFYLCYASLFLSQRPMFYLNKEYKNSHSIQLIQDKMRDLDYKFYPSFNEALTMKSAVEPYCKNKNKIGIIVSNGYMIYSTKFLELNKDCSIEALNTLHINNYDLKKYDVLLTERGLTQKVEVINKNDIKNPFTPNEKAVCYYKGLDSNRQNRLVGLGEIKNALGAECAINNEYLKKEGFTETKRVEAKLPKFLMERTNETVKDLSIWEKK